MSFSDIIGIAGLAVGIIGVVVGIIGCLNLSKANKLKAKEINNSTVNQAETLIVHNGLDCYAVVKLAQDTTKTAPVLVHAVDELEKQGYIPNVVVLLQATCPIREENLCENAIFILENNLKYDSVFAGFQKSYTMALWTKDKDDNACALYDYHLRPRWQDVEVNNKLMAEQGSFYAIKYDAFKKYKDFIGANPYIYEVSKTVDIDTLEDFEIAETLIKEK